MERRAPHTEQLVKDDHLVSLCYQVCCSLLDNNNNTKELRLIGL